RGKPAFGNGDEFFAAAGRTEIIGAALILRAMPRGVRIDLHAADGIGRESGLTFLAMRRMAVGMIVMMGMTARGVVGMEAGLLLRAARRFRRACLIQLALMHHAAFPCQYTL